MNKILKKIISKFNRDLGKLRANDFKNQKLIKKFIKKWGYNVK